MQEPKPEFVREQFSSNGLMFLFCVACGKLVAYSARADALSIAELAHSQKCPCREVLRTGQPMSGTA
jgi:hypothetical protein